MVARSSRSTPRTVSTVRPVISRTPARISTGCVLRVARDPPTMECESWTHGNRDLGTKGNRSNKVHVDDFLM